MCIHILPMAIEFDPEKDAANIAKHGVSLSAALEMVLDDAVIVPDTRFDYGEDRFNAYGMIGGTLPAMTFTLRGDDIRVISLRRARPKELKRYTE
ncbi:BrnT family toxin [Brevundimonas sp.]|uniref:BrnT family toxin n=1 Tax=Brevundimonas sp. TaxID=1871086 RepID=UPI003F720710